MEPLHIIGIVLAVLIVGYLIYYFFLRKPESGDLIHLPLRLLGFKNIPAVPFSLEATAQAALKLAGRAKETSQALNGLSNEYTIQGKKANSRSFLYGRTTTNENQKAREEIIKEMEQKTQELFKDENHVKERIDQASPLTLRENPDSLTQLFLNEPKQFSLSWTTFNGVYDKAQSRLSEFSTALTVDAAGAEAASRLFWPLIANHGMAFNLIIPKKLPTPDQGPMAGKKCFRIDMRLFEQFKTTQTDGFDRMTPGVIVDLYQDSDLNLIPYKIQVFKDRGATCETFEYGPGSSNGTTPSMWVYAIQAAKAAVTAWGIWLGHVYHWHTVTAALQMTMFQALPTNHDIRTILDPMSDYLIGFDNFLLLAFEHIAPPTSFKTGLEFISLQDAFASGRAFHDDDPKPTLQRLGLKAEDFTSPGATQPWDRYPIVGYLLNLWEATEEYVTVYVREKWPNDDAVINDTDLHTWLDASRNPEQGNVMGIPAMNGKGAQRELIDLLTSYVYRITAHGSSRMNAAANPVLSFVANYPPCLQSEQLYAPTHVLSQEELLRFLPNTGTIGSMITFLYIFVFSAPYESFIPSQGIDQDLFFGENKKLNDALIQFRRKVEAVLKAYDSDNPMIHQWPRNIET